MSDQVDPKSNMRGWKRLKPDVRVANPVGTIGVVIRTPKSELRCPSGNYSCIIGVQLLVATSKHAVRSPMKGRANDTEAKAAFPPPPVAASESLVPITSWPEMFQETAITGVERSE